eukprot:m.279222 g.279222  ORF g.279222 m.279222 type:complete len:2469 (-) comp17728_c0_seq2:683-8089(-)
MVRLLACLLVALSTLSAKSDQDPAIVPHKCFYTSSNATIITTMTDAVVSQSLRLLVPSTWNGDCTFNSVYYASFASPINITFDGQSIIMNPLGSSMPSPTISSLSSVSLITDTGFAPTAEQKVIEFPTKVRYPASIALGGYSIVPTCGDSLVPLEMQIFGQRDINECNYSTPMARPFVKQLGRGNTFQATLISMTVSQQPLSLSHTRTWLAIQADLYDDMDFGLQCQIYIRLDNTWVRLPLVKARVVWVTNTTTTALNSTQPISIYHHTLTYGLLIPPYTPLTEPQTPLVSCDSGAQIPPAAQNLTKELDGFEPLVDTTPPIVTAISNGITEDKSDVQVRAIDLESGVQSCRLQMNWTGAQFQVLTAFVVQPELMSGNRYNGTFSLSVPFPPIATNTSIYGTLSCTSYADLTSEITYLAGLLPGVDNVPPRVSIDPTSSTPSTIAALLTWNDRDTGVVACNVSARPQLGFRPMALSITQAVNLTGSHPRDGSATVSFETTLPDNCFTFQAACQDEAHNIGFTLSSSETNPLPLFTLTLDSLRISPISPWSTLIGNRDHDTLDVAMQYTLSRTPRGVVSCTATFQHTTHISMTFQLKGITQAIANLCEVSLPFASLGVISGWYTLVSTSLVLDGFVAFETDTATLSSNPMVDTHVFVPFTPPALEGPVLTSLNVTINSTLTAIAVGVDDLEGVSACELTINTPRAQQQLSWSLKRGLSPVRQGTVLIDINDLSPGEYEVLEVNCSTEDGRSTRITAKQIRERAFKYMQASFTIINDDFEAPTVTSVLISPNQINTTLSAAPVTVNITVTDVSSPVDRCQLLLLYDQAMFLPSVHSSGKVKNVTLSTTILLPQDSERRLYTLNITCYDTSANSATTQGTFRQVGYSSKDEDSFEEARVLPTEVDVGIASATVEVQILRAAASLTYCDAYFVNNVSQETFSTTLNRDSSVTTLVGDLRLAQSQTLSLYQGTSIFCYDVLGLASVTPLSTLSILATSAVVPPVLSQVRITPGILDLSSDGNASVMVRFERPTGMNQFQGWNVTLSDGNFFKKSYPLACAISEKNVDCQAIAVFPSDLGPFGVFRVAEVEVYLANGEQYIYDNSNDTDTITLLQLQLHDLTMITTHNWQKDGQDVQVKATVQLKGFPAQFCILELVNAQGYEVSMTLYPLMASAAPIQMKGSLWMRPYAIRNGTYLPDIIRCYGNNLTYATLTNVADKFPRSYLSEVVGDHDTTPSVRRIVLPTAELAPGTMIQTDVEVLDLGSGIGTVDWSLRFRDAAASQSLAVSYSFLRAAQSIGNSTMVTPGIAWPSEATRILYVNVARFLSAFSRGPFQVVSVISSTNSAGTRVSNISTLTVKPMGIFPANNVSLGPISIGPLIAGTYRLDANVTVTAAYGLPTCRLLLSSGGFEHLIAVTSLPASTESYTQIFALHGYITDLRLSSQIPLVALRCYDWYGNLLTSSRTLLGPSLSANFPLNISFGDARITQQPIRRHPQLPARDYVTTIYLPLATALPEPWSYCVPLFERSEQDVILLPVSLSLVGLGLKGPMIRPCDSPADAFSSIRCFTPTGAFSQTYSVGATVRLSATDEECWHSSLSMDFTNHSQRSGIGKITLAFNVPPKACLVTLQPSPTEAALIWPLHIGSSSDRPFQTIVEWEFDLEAALESIAHRVLFNPNSFRATTVSCQSLDGDLVHFQLPPNVTFSTSSLNWPTVQRLAISSGRVPLTSTYMGQSDQELDSMYRNSLGLGSCVPSSINPWLQPLHAALTPAIARMQVPDTVQPGSEFVLSLQLELPVNQSRSCIIQILGQEYAVPMNLTLPSPGETVLYSHQFTFFVDPFVNGSFRMPDRLYCIDRFANQVNATFATRTVKLMATVPAVHPLEVFSIRRTSLRSVATDASPGAVAYEVFLRGASSTPPNCSIKLCSLAVAGMCNTIGLRTLLTPIASTSSFGLTADLIHNVSVAGTLPTGSPAGGWQPMLLICTSSSHLKPVTATERDLLLLAVGSLIMFQTHSGYRHPDVSRVQLHQHVGARDVQLVTRPEARLFNVSAVSFNSLLNMTFTASNAARCSPRFAQLDTYKAYRPISSAPVYCTSTTRVYTLYPAIRVVDGVLVVNMTLSPGLYQFLGMHCFDQSSQWQVLGTPTAPTIVMVEGPTSATSTTATSTVSSPSSASEMPVTSTTSAPPQLEESADKSNSNLPVLIGAAAGGLVLILLVVCLVKRRSKSKVQTNPNSICVEADLHEGNMQLHQLRNLSSRPRSHSDTHRTDMSLESMLAAVQSPASDDQHATVAQSFLSTNSVKQKARQSLSKLMPQDAEGYMVPVQGAVESNYYAAPDQVAPSLEQYAYATSSAHPKQNHYMYAEAPAAMNNDEYEVPVTEVADYQALDTTHATYQQTHQSSENASATAVDYAPLGQHQAYAQQKPQYSSSLTDRSAADDENIYASPRAEDQALEGRTRAVSASHQRHARTDAAGSAV